MKKTSEKIRWKNCVGKNALEPPTYILLIATGGVLGILAALPGIAIETLMDYKNVHNNIITCKYAFQSYQHLMIQIKTALRLGRYDREHLVNCINNVDNYIIDTCPLVDKFKKKYQKKLTSRSSKP